MVVDITGPDAGLGLAIVPSYVPWPATMVALSGGAEILGGIGIGFRRTRIAAGWGADRAPCRGLAGKHSGDFDWDGHRRLSAAGMDALGAIALPTPACRLGLQSLFK